MIVCIKFLDYTHQKYKKFMLDDIALSKNVLFFETFRPEWTVLQSQMTTWVNEGK